MPTCTTCKQEYDNGTNSLHGCDPMVLLREFCDALENGVDLTDLYLRVRRIFADIDEARA